MTIAELVTLAPLVTREALEEHDGYSNRGDYFRAHAADIAEEHAARLAREVLEVQS